ncbi:UPF0149 family protein [Aquabacterium sp.]|uniref:UPF0149 family protein n=1 Tax=Aquabacterium sp. TaxID=1872578 RepID=UPI0024877BA2|nr:UPF0149 family protein [Aquabacterium sp.]MDI1259214.1 UPF0149 family protein [Aquabacterium sp.]
MTDDDIQLIHSPLTQAYSADGHTLQIQIYRSEGAPWILEIEDELGTSTVWDAPFESDEAALVAAFEAIQAEGVHSFLTDAPQAAQAPGQRHPHAMGPSDDPMAPLTEAELAELDQFLLHDVADEGMTLAMLDGYLHALAIGPITAQPSQWLPKVWGQDSGMAPPVDDMAQLNQVLGWVMRHFNSIVSGFEEQPPVLVPLWDLFEFDEGPFEDAEVWAHGFTEGVNLNRAAWQTLLDDPQGQRWYRPIGLLGETDFSPEQHELTRTPAQRQALAEEIENSLLNIHAFWLPLRQAVYERQHAQRVSTKVGRNEPCPCGSGKKFKKCCGAPSELH